MLLVLPSYQSYWIFLGRKYNWQRRRVGSGSFQCSPMKMSPEGGLAVTIAEEGSEKWFGQSIKAQMKTVPMMDCVAACLKKSVRQERSVYSSASLNVVKHGGQF